MHNPNGESRRSSVCDELDRAALARKFATERPRMRMRVTPPKTVDYRLVITSIVVPARERLIHEMRE